MVFLNVLIIYLFIFHANNNITSQKTDFSDYKHSADTGYVP